ncbi:MAG: glutathione peroxidase [Saprospiraceae bacterium]|nr:glutathione peroxidase [Saprospiraceae bacterium]MBP9194770.1 glutathione peroxidase [Saprospiraceae bacterium]
MKVKSLFKKWIWDRLVFPSFFHPTPQYRPSEARSGDGFYSLGFYKNDGNRFSFEQLRGKKVIIINTASACGYTSQYADWEQFYSENNIDFEILAFPSNQFLQQEKGTDQEIADFCSLHFKLHFPLFKKSEVRGKSKNEVYRWLSSKSLNGWNHRSPAWNFNKYVVDSNGQLRAYFPSKTRPQDREFTQLINELR